MDVNLDASDLADRYTSSSQRVRVITEAWVRRNGYCLACESDRLTPTPANTQARDFECARCAHPYELKSAKSPFHSRVLDGAYASMMRRISSSTVPSFLLLQYTTHGTIANLWAIHHLFITPASIQARKPLALTAQKAGWVGCNILLSGIPPEGRIPLILDGVTKSKQSSRARFASTERLSHVSPSGRGWAATLLKLLHQLGKQQFTLAEAYALEAQLSRIFPANLHIRPKIRQQLQILRDAGLLAFEARGVYRFSED